MNITIWNDDPTRPFVNKLNCLALNHLYDANPVQGVRSELSLYLDGSETFLFLPITSIIPPTMLVYDANSLFVYFGGTSGTTHIAQLLEGWTSAANERVFNNGICSAFYNATQVVIDAKGPSFFVAFAQVYFIGHSYGGAVAEAFMARLSRQLPAICRAWSYGSPRPGNVEMQRQMVGLRNTRFFADNDPVRFIPPHSSENPALRILSDAQLIRGCDTQTVPPIGYQIDETGTIQQYEGNPTPLTGVGLSVASWCTDSNGFRSVNHALGNYIQRFGLAFGNSIPPRPRANPNPLQPDEKVTIRERAQLDEQGLVALERSVFVPNSASNQYAVPVTPSNPAARYRRKKFRSIWVVDYDGTIVAVGPGKRHAGQMARRWNKVLAAERVIQQPAIV